MAELGLVVMAYGTPATPGGHRGVLHAHPARPRAERRAARRAHRPLRAPSAAPRRWPSAPRRSGPALAAALERGRAGPLVGRARAEARGAVHRGRGRRARRRRRAAASSASCSRRTTRARRSASTTSGCAAAAAERGLARRRDRELAPRAHATSPSSPTPCARRSPGCPSARRCCSPPTRCPSGRWSTTRTPTSCSASAAAVAEAAGLDRWAGWSLGWQSAGRTADPWRGPGHPRGDRRPRRHRPGRRRARVPAGLRERPPRGGLRPRPRGPPAGRRARPASSAAPACSTTTPTVLERAGRPRPRGSAGMSDAIDVVVVGGRHHRPRRGARARARRAPRSRSSSRIALGGKVQTSRLRRRRARRGRRRVPGPRARGRRAVPRPRASTATLVSPAGAAAPTCGAAARCGRCPRATCSACPPTSTSWPRPGIVSTEGLEAAGRDITTPLVAPDEDPTIGAFLRGRLGDEVVDRLVDPLVGGINAGAVDHLSLAATVPQIDAAARSGAPSLIEACRAQRAPVRHGARRCSSRPRAAWARWSACSRPTCWPGASPSGPTAAVRPRRRRPRRLGGRAPPTAGPSAGRGRRAGHPGAGSPARCSSRTRARPAGTSTPSTTRRSRSWRSPSSPDAIDRQLDGSGFLVPRVEGRDGHGVLVDHRRSGRTCTATAPCGCGRRSGATATTPRCTCPTTRSSPASSADLGEHDGAARARAQRPGDPVVALVPAVPRPTTSGRDRGLDDEVGAACPAWSWPAPRFEGLGVPACIRQGTNAARRVLAALGAPS